MTKRKKPPRELRPVTDAEIDAVLADAFATAPTQRLSLHELFDQQARAVMESTELDEDQKQSILVALQCPCCGGGAGALTFKLKPKA
jgi:hypothetical protein